MTSTHISAPSTQWGMLHPPPRYALLSPFTPARAGPPLAVYFVAPGQVADAQWDPLSDWYMLVALKNGSLTLWDMDSGAVMHSFDRQVGCGDARVGSAASRVLTWGD